MGRYYNGDIDGKFMFAVQSSTAADRFGDNVRQESNYVNYYFTDEHIPTIKKELAKLEKDFKKVDLFFEGRDSWSNKDQKDAGISEKEMSNYADYQLGHNILTCLEQNGSCSFEAEL